MNAVQLHLAFLFDVEAFFSVVLPEYFHCSDFIIIDVQAIIIIACTCQNSWPSVSCGA